MTVALAAHGVPKTERNVGSRMTGDGLALASDDGDGADMIDHEARTLISNLATRFDMHESQTCRLRWENACRKQDDMRSEIIELRATMTAQYHTILYAVLGTMATMIAALCGAVFVMMQMQG